LAQAIVADLGVDTLHRLEQHGDRVPAVRFNSHEPVGHLLTERDLRQL